MFPHWVKMVYNVSIHDTVRVFRREHLNIKRQCVYLNPNVSMESHQWSQELTV